MKCFRCGDCCKIHFNDMKLTQEELDLLPITLDVIQVDKNRFKVKGNICPFLSFSSSSPSFNNDNMNSGSSDIHQSINSHCSIYDIRPCQCRLFHCGRIKPTDKKLTTILEIQYLMSKDTNYREFKEKMDKDAIEWGNDHGWNWKKARVD